MAVDEFLGSSDAEISILALSGPTKETISHLLNPIKVIKNAERLPRNWEGLASICGIGTHFIPSIESAPDRTAKLLQMWYTNNKDDATVGQLIRYLERLDRTDVVDDILPLVAKDLRRFKELSSTTSTPTTQNTSQILTVGDAESASLGLDLQQYDAFVLFDEDDIEFAAMVVDTLEKQYDLNLCISNRDLLLGTIQNSAISEIMTNRSSRVIVILSRKFLNSETGVFLFSVAQQIALERRRRKIVPIVYKGEDDSYDLNLPPDINIYVKLDYRNEGKPLTGDFWGRLVTNIKAPDDLISNATRRRVMPRSISPIVLSNPAIHNGLMLNPAIRNGGSLTTLQNISNIPEPGLVSARSETDVGARAKTGFLRNFNIFKFRSSARSEQSEQSVRREEPTQNSDSNQENIVKQPTGKKIKNMFSISKRKKKKSEKKIAVPVAS